MQQLIIQLASNGSWGAVAQKMVRLNFHLNGVEVIEREWVVRFENESIFASHITLDSARGILWMTDGDLEIKVLCTVLQTANLGP